MIEDHFLTLLRNKETKPEEFRIAATRLGSCLAHSIASKIPLTPRTIQTPLESTSGATLETKIVLVPILRSGIALLSPFLEIFPTASVGFFGIRRDEKTAAAELYYENLPQIPPGAIIILLDPMLATGGTTCLAIERLLKKGAYASKIHLVSIVASKPGVAIVKKSYPKIEILAAAMDPGLDSKKFIVPGLGDFGDRYFST